MRPLWNDELFTLYVARLPSLSDTWLALLTGAEQLPIIYYALMRGVISVFGDSPIALRFPSIVGFIAASASIFFFLRKRIPLAYALAAALLPATHGLFWYHAINARPYGLIFGSSGVALCCWQCASQREKRWWALLGLFLALFLAVGCHYYAVLIVFPLVLGELIRTTSSRQIDAPIWAILIIAPALALAFSFPLAIRATENIGYFWTKPPRFIEIYWVFKAVLVPISKAAGGAILAALLATMLLFPYAMPTARSLCVRRKLVSFLPGSEWGAIAGFALFPLLGFGLALVTGVYLDRHLLPVLLGASVLVVLPLPWLLREDFFVRALIVVLVLAILGPMNAFQSARAAISSRQELEVHLNHIKSIDTS